MGIRSQFKEMMMSKETVDGAVQKGVGSVKQAAAKAVHNDKLVAEGPGEPCGGHRHGSSRQDQGRRS